MIFDASIVISSIILVIFVIAVPLSWYYFNRQTTKSSSCSVSNKVLEERIVLLQERNKSLSIRIDHLEGEFVELRDIVESMNLQKVTESVEKKIVNDDDHFDKAMQYHQFLQKNYDVLELLKEGLSIDQTAKRLNKSIREVEMVYRLLK